MENNKISKEIERMEKLKNEFEKGNIKLQDISEEDAILMNVLYELEISELEEKIDNLESKIQDYKKRMKAAIEYLKSKRN